MHPTKKTDNRHAYKRKTSRHESDRMSFCLLHIEKTKKKKRNVIILLINKEYRIRNSVFFPKKEV